MTWSLALSLAEVVWALGAAVYIVLQRRSPVATMAWALVLALMPVVGLPVYILFGPRRIARKRKRSKLARDILRGAPVARDVCACEAAIQHPFARVGMALGEPPPLLADVTLLDSGAAAYDAILEAIRGARHHVHLEYFIFEPGKTAERFREALIDARSRGVEVRLLVDRVGSFALSRSFLRPLREAGAKLCFFNSITLGRFRLWYVNFRTHRKIVIVDGNIGFTGSMNVDDLHDEGLSGDEGWRDLHLRLAGDAVAALQLVFLENWLFSSEERPMALEYLPKPVAQGSIPVQIVASGPDSFAIYKQWIAAIGGARERAWIVTPYFVPDEPMLEAILSAALRGVDVRLLIPARGDSWAVDAAARSYLPALVEAGAKVLRLRNGMLHAKVLVVDHDFASIGTLNMDNRSFRLNFEVTASLFDPAVVNETAAWADSMMERSEPARSRTRESIAERFAQSWARLLSPLL